MEPNPFPSMHALAPPKELWIHLQHACNHISSKGGLEGALIIDDVAVATLQHRARRSNTLTHETLAQHCKNEHTTATT